jgi:branched-chain amino acid aminotransferase
MMPNYGEKIWFNGSFVDTVDANVHVMTHAIHYGSSVFEGIKSYYQDGVQVVFRLDEHVARLRRSANIYGWDYEYSDAEIRCAILDLVKLNEGRDLYIRPCFFFGTGYETIELSDKVSRNFMIATWELPKGSKKSYTLTFSPYVRPPKYILDCESKCAANYVNSMRIRDDANQRGFNDAIALDVNGYLAEVSTANIFFIKDDVLYTPDVECSILNGITRQSVIKFAGDLGVCVVEGKFKKEDVLDADGIFISGTAAEIICVSKLDDVMLDEHIIYTKINELFYDVVYNHNEQYLSWLAYVN